jgi:hypothetical protein
VAADHAAMGIGAVVGRWSTGPFEGGLEATSKFKIMKPGKEEYGA